MNFASGVPMTGVRLAAVLALMAICLSCGETYRPVATPIIPSLPNPGFSHIALFITGNGLNNPGASTSIDVSGDTAISRSTVGLMPVNAVLIAGNRVYVANSVDDTISTFSPSSATPVITVSLPAGSVPSFVGTAETDLVFVANFGSNTVPRSRPPVTCWFRRCTEFRLGFILCRWRRLPTIRSSMWPIRAATAQGAR